MILKSDDSRLKIYGLKYIDQKAGDFWRLPEEMMKIMPQYDKLGKRPWGGRIQFDTDSKLIKVKFTLHEATVDPYMGLSGSSGMDVYFGRGASARFGGLVCPLKYGKDATAEATIWKGGVMDTVTINLPRNDFLKSFEIELDDDCTVTPSAPYAISTPIVFYGSSITEGGCAPRPGCAYTSIVTRALDADYYCYGFSGSAKGEEEFAHFIANHEKMSLFVYDYDHNAPTPEHLAQTHSRFLEIVREKHPDVPVLLLSRPNFEVYAEDSTQRRAVIKETYKTAVAKGDKNIYFVDGESFFGDSGRQECTVDATHPNALGFMKMSEVVLSAMRKALAGRK